MSPQLVCKCGCGKRLINRREGTLYFDERCKRRAHRRKVKKALAAAGLPTSLSLQAATTTRTRPGDARTARRPDLRVSYRRAVDAVADVLVRLPGIDERAARRCATNALKPLLSEKARRSL